MVNKIEITDRELMLLAVKARKNAYAPYSLYRVGAALLTKSGKVFLGCNIENASFGATNCAERTAIFKAVSEGEEQFEKIAIVGGKDCLSDDCVPCGVCRQVMCEFCSSDFKILLGTPDSFKQYTLQELIPHSFTNENL